MKVLLVVQLLTLLTLVVYGWVRTSRPGPVGEIGTAAGGLGASALGCHFFFLRCGSRHQVSVPHELEVVAPEPASASLLDKRQPATSTPQVHCYGAEAEQFSGWRAG